MVIYWILFIQLHHFWFIGVDNRRFLAEKNDPESTADIARANEESDTNAREKIYDKNRPALCSQIR
jgi:hypothetical protein